MTPSLRRARTTLAALLLALAAALLLVNPAAVQETAPTLTAQPAAGAVNLTWTQVEGAHRYQLITWWHADTGWQQIGGDNLTAAAFSHTDLTIGTTYYYRIRALDADGRHGPWSEQVSATPHADLAAPDLSAQPATAAVALTWTEVPDAARYQLITWWDVDTGWQQIAGDNLTAVAYTHTDLTAGATYYYRIRARSAAGEPGPWSQQRSATVPNAPDSTAAPAHTFTPAPAPPSATPTLAAAPSATPTAPPALTATPTPTAIPAPTQTPTPTPTTTPPATSHEPDSSNTLVLSDLQAPVLTAQVAGGTVALSWTPIDGAARYEVTSWTDAGGWQPVGGDNLTAAAYNQSGLTAATAYYFYVRAVSSSGGPGPWSEPVSVTLPETQPSASSPTPTPTAAPASTPAATAAPGSVSLSSGFTPPVLTVQAKDGAIEVSWNAVPTAVRYILITWWEVDTGWQDIGGDNLTATTYSHTTAVPGTTYYYSVRAVNAAGDLTPWSDYPSASLPAGPTPTPTPTPSPAAAQSATPTITPTTTPTATPSSGPAYGFVTRSNISAVRAGPNITLSWNPLPAAIHYNIYYCLSVGEGVPICRSALFFRSAYELVARELTVTSFLHEGLLQAPAGAAYSHFYVVQACFRAACPILTRQLPTVAPVPTATPTATAAPTPTSSSAAAGLPAPTLTVAAANGAIELRWTAVPGAVRYILLSWWDSKLGWQDIGGDTLTAATFTHTEFTPGQTYFYAVRAVNAAGDESPWSAYPSVIAPAAPTPTPAPTQTAGARVSSPPSSLGVHAYYTKYLDAAGVPVLSSNDVSDEELYQVRDTFLAMLSDRPDLIKTMSDYAFRLLIYPDRFEKGGHVSDLPEFKGLGFSWRVAGAAGKTPYGWVAGGPEVARHCNHIMIHEIAHLVEDALRLQPEGEQFMYKLNSAYQAAMLRGLWQDRYASTNALEYWAELVRTWLTPSQFDGWIGPGYHKLADYDPVGAALVKEILGNPAPLTFCQIQRFDLQGTVSGPTSQTPLAHSYILQLSMRSPTGAKRLLGASTTVRRSDRTFSFERLFVEKAFLNASGEKPHIVIGIYRYNSAGNAACPAAAFLNHDGSFVRTTDQGQWKRIEVTGNHITGLAITIPPNLNWLPLHKCI